MLTPQLEDGYTRIANEILERLIEIDLSGQEFRLLLFLFRKTYGFSKCEDAISLSQMITATGMTKVRCSQVINKLQLRNSVTVTENRNGLTKKYKFNKDFDAWVGVTENRNGIEKTNVTVTEKRNEPLRKTVTTKETITKENIQKKGLLVSEKQKQKKHKFLECVFFTDDEIIKLRKMFNGTFDKAVEYLNNYKMSNNKKYASDYHVMIGWIAEKFNIQKLQNKPTNLLDAYYQNKGVS